MELDHCLHKVQGVLKSKQRVLGDLNTIKKEHEESISKIVDSLTKVVDDDDFNTETKRRLYILLYLNTETDIYNDLKKNRNCAHLVGFFPKLSRDLFIKIVIGLQLHQFLYESVQGFCSSLSYHVLDLCLDVLSWLDLFELVGLVENLLSALFSKIVVMDENDKYNTHFKDTFQRLLLHYDAEKGGSIKRMRLWKSNKLKHYAGLVMASLLSLLDKCTKIYCKKDVIINSENLYNIQIELETVKVNPTAGTENSLVTVQQCYEYVVAKCLENICAVTIELWLFWVEVDLDDIPDTENTLQRLIGERAYLCREALRDAESLKASSKEASDLISRLENIALKPPTEEELASALDLTQILANVQNTNKDTKKWIKYLINNSSFNVEPAVLDILKNHIKSLETTSVLKLSKLLFDFIKKNQNCVPQKRFVIEMIKSLDYDSQVEVSKCFLTNFGLTEILKTEDFQPLYVDIFNKVINEEDKEKELYPQFLSLAFQNAEVVVNLAVAEGITSEVRGHLMADILGKLQAFCDACPAGGTHSLLVTSLNKLLLSLPDLPENQQVNYPLFVRELVMRRTLDGEQFIKSLMAKMHLLMKTKNWAVIIACLVTLSELYDVDCVHNCPANLVMLVQLVQAKRWSPSTFNMAAVKVCELALQLIDQFVTKWFNIGFEDKKLKNLTMLVQQCTTPVNRYSLYRLLEEEPMPSDPALQLLYRMHYGIGEWSVLQVTPDERLKLVYCLCFYLPVLTSNEWQELFCVAAPKCSEFLCLFNLVTDSLLLCLDSAKVNPDPAVISCLSFAVINVAQVVKYELNRWNENDNEYRISVLSKMCQLLSSLPADQQETLGLTMIKVLQQLLPEGSRRKPLTPEEMNSVTASIASIKAANVRQNLAKEFLEMVHR